MYSCNLFSGLHFFCGKIMRSQKTDCQIIVFFRCNLGHQPFCKFISARLVTMVIEVGGVWLLVSVMGLNDMIGKFLTQFIVLILNYIFSKFFVFTTGKRGKNS